MDGEIDNNAQAYINFVLITNNIVHISSLFKEKDTIIYP